MSNKGDDQQASKFKRIEGGIIASLPSSVFGFNILSQYLSIEDASKLDRAVTNRSLRSKIIDIFQAMIISTPMRIKSDNQCTWIKSRGIKVTQALLDVGVHIGVPSLISFLNANDHLTGVKVNSSITDNSLEIWTQPTITCKNLEYCECDGIGMTLHEVTALTNNCPKLKLLSIRRPNQISDDEFLSIIKVCSHLHELHIICIKTAYLKNNHFNYTSEALVGRSQQNTIDNKLGLGVLLLHRVSITTALLIELSKYCPNLSCLHFDSCEMNTEAGLTIFGTGFPSLVSFSFSCFVSDEFFLAISNGCPHLKYIQIMGCSARKITQQAAKYISVAWPLLEGLKIYENDQINDEFLQYLFRTCHSILRLELSGCNNITATGLQIIIRNCPKLQRFEFYSERADLTDANLHTLGLNSPYLTDIELYASELTDEGMAAFTRLGHNITIFRIWGDSSLTDRAIMYIAQAYPNLKSVLLHDFCGSNLTLKYISDGCPYVERIAINSPFITDDGLLHLVKCRFLKELDLWVAGNERTSVTQYGVQRLAYYLKGIAIRWSNRN